MTTVPPEIETAYQVARAAEQAHCDPSKMQPARWVSRTRFDEQLQTLTHSADVKCGPFLATVEHTFTTNGQLNDHGVDVVVRGTVPADSESGWVIDFDVPISAISALVNVLENAKRTVRGAAQ